MNKQITDKIKQYLNNVFAYYNRKYNLNTELIFCNEEATYARNEWKQKKLISSKIYYSIDYILSCFFDNGLSGRLSYKTEQELLVQVLLHEIKHIMEAKSGLLYYELYILNAKKLKHDDRPLEKRADFFANSEIKNWGCNFLLK
jgi:hypothetical protein